jgi:purine catabolism regulator
VSLTIRALTEIPYLRTRVQAGAAGGDRVIAWAHSIELPRPWEWLEPGDLLMTVGLGVPADPAEQVAYVESLAAVGVSGVAIGEDMHAPPLSPAMAAAADAHALPLLITAYEVPFVQISRAVAAVRSGPEPMRSVRAMRVYDEARAALADQRGPEALVEALGEQLGCRLVVCDPAGRALFGDRAIAEALVPAYLDALAHRAGPPPALVRLPAGDATAVAVPVPARRPGVLIALPQAGEAPSFALMQHVATVVALEAERLAASREQLRRVGSETFVQLLGGRLSPASAAAALAVHGLGDRPLVALAIAGPEGLEDRGDLHHLLAEQRIPNLLLRRTDVLLALVEAGEEPLARVAGLLDDDLTVGVSEPFSEAEQLPEAVREARWALAAAGDGADRVARYGEASWLFGPRSIAEARAVVDRVLGPVLEYDRGHDTKLVPSLVAFLRCNRSWQRTTAELFVHRQTLVYRMRRVEQLTGRSLSDTGDVAEIWLAAKALDLLD